VPCADSRTQVVGFAVSFGRREASNLRYSSIEHSNQISGSSAELLKHLRPAIEMEFRVVKDPAKGVTQGVAFNPLDPNLVIRGGQLIVSQIYHNVREQISLKLVAFLQPGLDGS